MAFWLMKSEPDEYSIQQLLQDQHGCWDGVRNYQARNFMREMQPGDEFFFYHASCPTPGIAGIGKIADYAKTDLSAFDPDSPYFDAKSNPQKPRWSSISVKPVCAFKRVIPLAQLRQQAELEGLLLLSPSSRLSVMPVSEAHWSFILTLAQPAHR